MFETEELSAPSNPYDYRSWIALLDKVSLTESSNLSSSEYNKFLEYFESFLQNYPLLYAYWSKYAQFVWIETESYEDVEKIFLKALDRNILFYQVEMWEEYIKFVTYHQHPDGTNHLRQVIASALDSIGSCFKSSPIWKLAIESERNNSEICFFLMAKAVSFSQEDLKEIWNDLLNLLSKIPTNIITELNIDISCTEFFGQKHETYHNADISTDDHEARAEAIEKLTSIYEKSLREYNERISFENSFSRNYFHFNVPDIAQISKWESYISLFENKFNESNDMIHYNYIIEIFERALIPCNHIKSIWLKYARFLETHDKIEEARSAYLRIPFDIIPSAKIFYAEFEEVYCIENAINIYKEMSTSKYAQHVISSAQFRKRSSHEESEIVEMLRNSRNRFLEENDKDGASLIASALFEMTGEPTDELYTATYISKLSKSFSDPQKPNELLYHSIYESPDVLLEDKVALLKLYLEYIREWGISGAFQFQMEMELIRLKNQLIWHKQYHEQTFLMGQLEPDAKMNSWIEYQKALE